MSPTILTAPAPAPAPAAAVSPLVLSDRLLTLAQEADRAGQHDTALCLVALVYTVFDEAPGRV